MLVKPTMSENKTDTPLCEIVTFGCVRKDHAERAVMGERGEQGAGCDGRETERSLPTSPPVNGSKGTYHKIRAFHSWQKVETSSFAAEVKSKPNVGLGGTVEARG